MKTAPIILAITVFTTIVGTTYFYIFHGELSVSSQDWASFGSYISGVLMPIFTAINIWVFVRLTQTIDKQNKKRSEEESEKQQTRHKAELEHQKRMIITQIRQAEISQLSKILDSSFIPDSNSCSDALSKNNSYKNNLARTLSEIDSFLNEKQYLFPTDKNEIAFRSLIKVYKMISEILNQFDDPGYKVELGNLLEMKHKAMIELYQYTTDNISNKL